VGRLRSRQSAQNLMPHPYDSSEDWIRENLCPHEEMLRAWLQSRYQSSVNVDDVVQEAFLRVIRAREREPLQSPKSFLFATARNLALDMVRHSSVAMTQYLPHEDLSEFEDGGMGVPEIVARNQELEIMTRAIQSMPDRCRQVFTLKKVYGMSPKNIAEELGISVNTVWTQLKIGLKRFTQYMDENLKEGDRAE